MLEQYYVYIMTNKCNTLLYIGVTNDLKKRAYEHRKNVIPGFTKKYKINKLVYYEVFDSSSGAITREKHIKSRSRQKKANLIRSLNPDWDDLSGYF